MKIQHILALVLLTTFMVANISSGVLDIMFNDHIQIELADKLDVQEEKEGAKEEKFKSRFNFKLINRASTKNSFVKGMLADVDLQSLFHPEIVTPPPERA